MTQTFDFDAVVVGAGATFTIQLPVAKGQPAPVV